MEHYAKPGVVYRIEEKRGLLGCINRFDGNGAIHALLEAYHPGYARSTSPYYRVSLAKSVRIGAIPWILKKYYNELTDKTVADAASAFTSNAVQFGTDLDIDYTNYYADFLGVAYTVVDINGKTIWSFTEKDTDRPLIGNETPCVLVLIEDPPGFHLQVDFIDNPRIGLTASYRISRVKP